MIIIRVGTYIILMNSAYDGWQSFVFPFCSPFDPKLANSSLTNKKICHHSLHEGELIIKLISYCTVSGYFMAVYNRLFQA